MCVLWGLLMAQLLLSASRLAKKQWITQAKELKSHWTKEPIPMSCPYRSGQNPYSSLWHACLAQLPLQVGLVGVFLQDSTPRWHIWLFEAGTMVVQAEQERENEGGREGGLFSSAHTSSVARLHPEQSQWKRQPSSSCSACSTCLLNSCYYSSGESTSYGLFPVVCFVSLICVVCIFSCYKDTVKYVVQCGICWEVIYWQWRLRCKIHTCCCQGILSNMSKIKWAAPRWLWAVCMLVQLAASDVQFPNSN